jgi:hypothetical protein
LFGSIFFYRVFGRFVARGVQKRDKQKSRENLLSSQKNKLLTYVTFFFFAAPLGFVCGRDTRSGLRRGGARRGVLVFRAYRVVDKRLCVCGGP